MDYCPNCGNEGTLDDETGWCEPCTLSYLNTNNLRRCLTCDRKFTIDAWHPYFRHCAACRKELRDSEVKEYAERLGISISAARKKVADAKRPRCLCCTEPIKGGKPGVSRFCTKKAKCRRARSSYMYKRQRKGYTPDEALKEVLEEIHGTAV